MTAMRTIPSSPSAPRHFCSASSARSPSVCRGALETTRADVMQREGLSCCIIAENEGDRIARCIEAVRGIVDEVVVVDSGSKDDTVAKAEALGARVIYNAWVGYGPQKRFAEDCAQNDWILNLDADEIVTPELARE